jgi:hypothetical protein
VQWSGCLTDRNIEDTDARVEVQEHSNYRIPTGVEQALGARGAFRPANRGRRVSHLVLLRYVELCIAVGVEGDGDEIRPAAYSVWSCRAPPPGSTKVSFSSQNAHA